MYVYFMFSNLDVKILHLKIFLLKCIASIVGLWIIYQFHSQAPKALGQETDGKQMDLKPQMTSVCHTAWHSVIAYSTERRLDHLQHI